MHEGDIIFVIMQHCHVLCSKHQSKPMAAPMAASRPVAENPKVVGAPLDLEVLVEEEPVPVEEPEAAPVWVVVPLGVALAAG
jgi:hypothetical protein